MMAEYLAAMSALRSADHWADQLVGMTVDWRAEMKADYWAAYWVEKMVETMAVMKADYWAAKTVVWKVVWRAVDWVDS
jgi:hypothetical protein